MEKKPVYLSLGAWPQTPAPSLHYQLTPISKRIFKQVHLVPEEILPLTFVEFCRRRKGRDDCSESSKEGLQFQNQRRGKQAAILGQIRSKYILGEDYNTPPQKKAKSKPRSLIKSRQLSKNSSHNSLHPSQHNEFSNIKVQQALSRIKSQRKVKIASFKSPTPRKRPKNEESDYFIHFDPHRHTGCEKQLQEQSTKGNEQKRSSILQPRHSEYGNFIFAKNTRLRTKPQQNSSKSGQEQSKQLCHQLLVTMERWQQLDRAHLAEMRKMGDLTPRQKQRLSKIQEIEKNQMRSRIKRIKSRLNSQSHHL